MLKKNSWIVALILALSLTALFTGCIDAIEDEGGNVTYTEVALGKFNVWGGQAYQQGWGVAGIKFSGIGDKTETAADLGYKIGDFQKAKFLVIEMEDSSHPKGNLDIIWGGEKEDGTDTGIGGWNQTGGIAYKKDGNTIQIELAKVLKDYSKFKAGTTAKVKIVLQAGGEPDKLAGLVKSAKLLIPDVAEPFVAVTDITLAKNSFPWSDSLGLAGTVTPDDATNQGIIWSLKSYLPAGGNPASDTVTARAALLAKVDFKATTLTVVSEKKYDDNSVWPPVSVDGGVGVVIPWKSENTIYVVGGALANIGDTIVVTARILDGKVNAKRDGTEIFSKDFTITVTEKLPIAFKVDGAPQTTIEYGGEANSGASSSMLPNSDGNGYTITMTGNSYGNAYSYLKVDFGADTFSDYVGVSFNYIAVSGDANFKDVRIKAMTTPPPSGYNPGLEISRVKTGEAKTETGAAIVAKFGDNDSSAPAAGAFTANLATLASESVIYFWVLPWSDGSETVYSLTNINFLKTLP